MSHLLGTNLETYIFNHTATLNQTIHSAFQLDPFGIQNAPGPNYYNNYSRTIDRLKRVSVSASTSRCESPDSISSSSSLFTSTAQKRPCYCTSDHKCHHCIGTKPRAQSRFSQMHLETYESSSSQQTTPSPPSLQGFQTTRNYESSAQAISPPSPSGLQGFQTTSSNILCDLHPHAIDFYCHTCNVATCGECGLNVHMGHLIVFLREAINATNIRSNEITIDVHLGIQAILKDLESVNSGYGLLDTRTKKAKEDLNTCMERLKAAVEERHKELLKEIEITKNNKWERLKKNEDILKFCNEKLNSLLCTLKVAEETSKAKGNPWDLKIANDKAADVIFELQKSRRALSGNEDWISFSAFDCQMIEAISNFGTVTFINPGLIGDGRILRGRGAAFPFERKLLPPLLPCRVSPRGRPIASSTHPVVVRTGPRFPGEHPQRIKIIGQRMQEPTHPDNLCRPWGVACDRDGNIIIADRSHDRLIIFREDGTCVNQFGVKGSGPGQFNRPAGVTVDERRRLVVADKDNHRIQILKMSGAFLMEFGKKGSECGQFNYPWDVATNSACEIVVSDTRNHRIQLFSAEGVFLRKFGFDNTLSACKILDSPRGVAFNPEGNVILSDFNTHRIVQVDYQFHRAKSLTREGVGKSNTFQRPQGVIVDDEGNIIVADSRNYKIKVFNRFGDPLIQFGKDGTDIEDMDRPSGVALFPDGRIVFVDFGNNRVVIR